MPTIAISLLAISSIHANGTIIGNDDSSRVDDDSDNYKITWSVNASSYSPSLPIHSFVDDWDSDLQGFDGIGSSKGSFTQGRTALDYQVKDSSLGYGLAMRYDYILDYNDATAEVYWKYKNDQLLDDNTQYPLHINAQHNHRYGFNVFNTFNVPQLKGWSLTPRMNVWKGVSAIDGEFQGVMNTLTDSPASMNELYDNIDTTVAKIDYFYDTPALKEEGLNWHPEQPEGYGYSVDVSLQGKFNEDNTRVEVNVYDVLGKVHWREMPMTRYELDYDVNGRPLYNIEGQLDKNNHTQKLPWRVEATLTHQLTNSIELGLHSQVNDISHLHQVSATYETQIQNQPVAMSIITEPQTQSAGVEINTKYGGVKWLTDDINTNEAQRADVSMFVNYDW